MAIDERFALSETSLGLEQLLRFLQSWLSRFVVTLVFAAWVAFWGLLVQIHLNLGDFLAAGGVVVFCILPAIIGLGYYHRKWLPVG